MKLQFLSFDIPTRLARNTVFHWGVSLMFSWSCSNPPEQSANLLKSDSTLNVEYAQGFAIDYYENQKVLSLATANDTLRYLLLPADETTYPDLEAEVDQIVRIPVQRVITQSTTHLAFLKMLGHTDVVVGLDKAAYVYDSLFTNRAASGLIQEVGSGNTLNTEQVVSLEPDLIFVSHMPGSDLSAYQKFIDLDILVLPVAEWTESTPLGKAEWLKLFASLLNKEEFALTKFSRTEEAYTTLAQLTQSVAEKPSVIVGTPFQGTWYVPGAESYRNALLQDAGADWAFSQDSTAVSFPVDFERMYDLGLQAEIWLDPGQSLNTKEVLGIDSRFADFSAFQSGRVYNSNRRLSASGGSNDYYESGVVYPQRILADLIKILHPELLPHHQLYYYQQLLE
ncbi:ABC transporter substrate-binding protein [Tunicatimonas pelagia]|uniref:ABC transporter substrate-binding protein n=1 Tax=Tunicatimonas pelagia TaxID=931531 RepID=UPI0026669F26|nr:ABC transporter substrate-binding protein [Tunicatimonas pelagia]WKN42647.1 ABC transporter substrate-binding protein [Tunicatimonas pelagia]